MNGKVTALAAGVLALAAAFVAAFGESPAAADEPPRPSRFEVHEWGVWVVDAGRVAHLPALAAECPSFVIRAEQPQTRIPRIIQSPVTVEKPVLFFHTDRPIENLRVRVRFREGHPWLFWPQALQRRSRLEWRGRLTPRAGLPELAEVLHRGRRHPWWGNLRRAGGARFEAEGGGAEDFLFYDGGMPFRSGFTFQNTAAGWSARRAGNEAKLWIHDGYQVAAYEASPGQIARQTGHVPSTDLLAVLRGELLGRGLEPAEADSLLQTWADDLVPRTRSPGEDLRPPRARAIYFVDETSYNRMLPLRIRPRPDETIRVGLVIEML